MVQRATCEMSIRMAAWQCELCQRAHSMPLNASPHVPCNASSHVCGNDRQSQCHARGFVASTQASEQAKAAHDGCNGGRGGACFRCKRAGVTCASFKSWALEREAGRSPSCRQLASPGQTVFTHARRAWVWIGVSLVWWGCGSRSTAVTGGRLCSRRLHCCPLGPALLADCLAILRSLTTTTRRRTLLGTHSGQPS
jgi:hypothetical protein